jgi:hypothetical protein
MQFPYLPEMPRGPNSVFRLITESIQEILLGALKSLRHGLIVRIVVAYGSSLISAVYISGFHIAAIGVDAVWTCETIEHTSNLSFKQIYQTINLYHCNTSKLVFYDGYLLVCRRGGGSSFYPMYERCAMSREGKHGFFDKKTLIFHKIPE